MSAEKEVHSDVNSDVNSDTNSELVHEVTAADEGQRESSSEDSSKSSPEDAALIAGDVIEPQELGLLRSTRELERCNQLYRSGSYEEAEAGYRALIQGPGEEKLLANLGYALQSQGRHREAAEAFESYLETFIARHHAWKALCFSYYHLADYENMTRCAREAIRWDIRYDTPDDYSWQQMATAHFLMGDYSTALKASRKASALNAENPFSRYYEACVIAALVEGATLDEPDLLSEPPTYAMAAELLADALEARPDLNDELLKEGYLDQVFPLLEEIYARREEERAQALKERDEMSEDDQELRDASDVTDEDVTGGELTDDRVEPSQAQES